MFKGKVIQCVIVWQFLGFDRVWQNSVGGHVRYTLPLNYINCTHYIHILMILGGYYGVKSNQVIT